GLAGGVPVPVIGDVELHAVLRQLLPDHAGGRHEVRAGARRGVDDAPQLHFARTHLHDRIETAVDGEVRTAAGVLRGTVLEIRRIAELVDHHHRLPASPGSIRI